MLIFCLSSFFLYNLFLSFWTLKIKEENSKALFDSFTWLSTSEIVYVFQSPHFLWMSFGILLPMRGRQWSDILRFSIHQTFKFSQLVKRESNLEIGKNPIIMISEGSCCFRLLPKTCLSLGNRSLIFFKNSNLLVIFGFSE